MKDYSLGKIQGGCQDQWSFRKLECCKPVACRLCDSAWNHKLQLVSEIINKYALKSECFEAVSGEIGKVTSLFPMETFIPENPRHYALIRQGVSNDR